MPITLINYTLFYFKNVSPMPIPSLVLGKFVQIRHGAELFLVLFPKDFTKYHANIVERFCLDQGQSTA